MMTNDDQPNPQQVQPMVGNAKLFLYNHPEPAHFFMNTLGWQYFLIRSWLNKPLTTIKNISPLVIRCYGMHLNLAIASRIKQKLNIPLLVSLHTHPILDAHKERLSFKQKIVQTFTMLLSKNLKNADLILPVYRGIANFLDNLNIKNYKILYNTVGVYEDQTKKKFDFDKEFKLICIGQQIPNKNPENLIRAVAKLEKKVSLDIVGTGMLNKHLKRLVGELKAGDRIKFISSVPHLELCENLRNYDCFAASIDCIGISKTVIESFLVKLPVLLNYNSHEQVPELNEYMCLRVSDTLEGYADGIKKLMQNKKLRVDLSEYAYKIAWENWSPEETERQHTDIYKKYMLS
jgi:glycosyltransferase involved in cell wall biosynthesis